MFLWVIQRDLLLAMRQRADVLTTLFFFIIVVSLFPLGVGPEINMLRSMAPGVDLPVCRGADPVHHPEVQPSGQPDTSRIHPPHAG